jgi:hypothetical protein
MTCRTIRLLATLAFALLAACSQGAEVTMRVLEAGAEPRQALRYQFTAGQTETAVMELSRPSMPDVHNKMVLTVRTAARKRG